jgi:hypothetical protein
VLLARVFVFGLRVEARRVDLEVYCSRHNKVLKSQGMPVVFSRGLFLLAERSGQMREIVVTGISKTEFRRTKNKLKGITHCYLCKRPKGQQGVFYDLCADSAKASELSFSWVGTIQHYSDEDVKLKYYVCHECLAFLEAIQEKSLFSDIKA